MAQWQIAKEQLLAEQAAEDKRHSEEQEAKRLSFFSQNEIDLMNADLEEQDQYIPDNHVENFVAPSTPVPFNTLEEEALRQVDEALEQGVQDSMHAIDPNAMMVSDEPISSPEPASR